MVAQEQPQLILVADDDKLLELAKKSKIQFDDQEGDASGIGSAVGIVDLLPFPARVGFKLLRKKDKERLKVKSEPPKKIPISKEEILKFIQKELKLSAEIHCVSPAEAKDIQFGIGDSATNGSFYLKHPVLNNVYIRPCDYEVTLAREKEVAFRRLASTLGAKTIVLKDAKFFEKNGDLSVSATLPKIVSLNIGISANFESNGAIIREVYSEYGIPRREPYIPDELKEWVRINPDLRLMTLDRLEGHLIKHQVTLELKDTFTGSGKIAAEIAKKGLDIGGSITKNVSSIWTFEVEYYPIIGTV